MVATIAAGNSAAALTAAALQYHARGWCVIPTVGKRAKTGWKKYQTERLSKDDLRSLFAQPGVTGVAVLLGSASGGLACRDYDSLDAFEGWKGKNPQLADRLPTVQTGRGRHLYFRGPEGFCDCGDGEYRAKSSHYCLLPPSRHPDGPTYQWLIRLPSGDLPEIDPYHTGLVPGETERTERTEEMWGVGGDLCPLCPLCLSYHYPER